MPSCPIWRLRFRGGVLKWRGGVLKFLRFLVTKTHGKMLQELVSGCDYSKNTSKPISFSQEKKLFVKKEVKK